MRPLTRKLLREVLATGTVIISILLIAAIGIACYVAMRTAYRSLSRAKDHYYARGRMADFWINLKKMPRQDLGRILYTPGVAEVVPRLRTPVIVDLPDVARPLAGVAISLPDFASPRLNQIEVLRGTYFTPRRRNELIVNDVFAKERNLAIGNRLTLLIGGRKEDFIIVGTAFSCEFIYPLGPAAIVPDREGYGIFFLKQSYAEDLLGMQGACNELVGRVSPGFRDHKRLVLHELERRLGDYGVLATIPLEDYPSNTFLSQEIQGLASFAFLIPVIFLSVAAVILNVVMIRRVEQQRQTIGTLKALGFGDATIAWHFIQYSLLVGGLGTLLGSLFGQWLARGMTDLYRQFYEFPQLPCHVYWDVHAEAAFLGLLAAAIGGWGGARMAVRVDPATAMRPRAPTVGRHFLLERIPWLWPKLSAGWRMALRTIMRHPLRTGAGLGACLLGSAIMALTFSLTVGIDYLMVFHFRWLYRSDVTVLFKSEQEPQALSELRHLPGVRSAEPILAMPVTLRHNGREKLSAVMGLEAQAVLTLPRDRFGRRIRIPPIGLVISRQLAQMLDVRPGEVLEWQSMRGDRAWRKSVVAALMDDYVGTAIYADLRYLERTLGEEASINRVQLVMDLDPRDQNRLLARLKERPQVEEVILRQHVEDNLRKTILQNIWIVLSIEIIFAGCLLFGTIFNNAVIGLEERRRELATLHVMGFSSWQIGWLMARESALVILVGLTAGLPLGYLFAYWIVSAYQSEILRMPLLYPPQVWIKTILFGLLFGALSQACLQLLLRRTAWLEAVKVNE